MSKLPLILIAALISSSAFASGFVCKTTDGNLNIRIYNQVQPTLGTKNASVMVFSDPKVQSPNRTVAVFKNVKNTLKGGHNMYVGKVDLRYKELTKGEYLLGTRLGYLQYVAVGMAFSESRPVAHGATVRGWLSAKKRDGSYIRRYIVCKRYLKQR